MRNTIILATVAVLGFGGVAEAGKCKGDKCGPAAPIVCEKVYLDPDLWEQVREKYARKGQTAWWQARSLVCGGNCVTYKKNYGAESYICAPQGSQVCYQDSITGKKHVWTIDGRPEPVR